MYSLAFPNMLNNSNTNILEDKEASLSNLKLLIKSDKESLFGDPYFGTNLKKMLFEQNSIVLRDLLVDDTYLAMSVYMPQLNLRRKDISVKSDGVNVYENIKCLNLLDYTTDLYNINITSDED